MLPAGPSSSTSQVKATSCRGAPGSGQNSLWQDWHQRSPLIRRLLGTWQHTGCFAHPDLLIPAQPIHNEDAEVQGGNGGSRRQVPGQTLLCVGPQLACLPEQALHFENALCIPGDSRDQKGSCPGGGMVWLASGTTLSVVCPSVWKLGPI